MKNDRLSTWSEVCRFIFSPEDSERMQNHLRTETEVQDIFHYCKTVFWIVAAVFLSLGICRLH